MRTAWTALLLVAALAVPHAYAGEGLSTRSTYLGDGWFQYDVTLHYDPFFTTATVELVGVPFTNQTEYGVDPANWTNLGTGGPYAEWAYDDAAPVQVRPYSVTFLARSTNTTFRTDDEVGILLAGLLWPQGFLVSKYMSVNIAYFHKLPVLVPCPPAEADGSATTLYSSAEFVPDVEIDEMYFLALQPHGLTFSWPTPCTVQIQSSTNCCTWSAVTNTLGSPPSTTWTSPAPLEVYGTFFRIRLLATDHHPELL